ncbi:type I DNA topoisomerase [Deferribacterales bacterium RsTz2092]|nr:DNA topoisomerase 1 [Deferribacterales bacterium]
MSKNLIIVESPAKAKTIGGYLGKDYEVLASVGHIVDLPEKGLGVDIENDFAPTYEVMPGKEQVVKKLKQAAGTADAVFIASDPDREGEAIAWHIQEQIKTKNKNIQRVRFNEITKQGIKDAVANPGELDMNRVNAQQSRRILDRLVGYKVSRLLWKPLKYGLSAGRVQSVALRLVCEREMEIEKFVPVESWTVEADFQVFDVKGKLKGNLKAMLDKHKGKKLELKNEKETDKVLASLSSDGFAIDDIEKKNVKSSAPEPFITARLQQEAIRKLSASAKRVMSIAQQLYEGVQLGSEGSQGLITYMRTDSTRISPEAEQAAAAYIETTYGKDYLGGRKTKKAAKANVQDAHEAVRPTSPTRTPASIQKYLTPEQYKLYKLIWERFMASQMADALYEQTTVLINNGDYGFRTSGRVLKFAGYTTLYTEGLDDDSADEETRALLNVDKNDGLKQQTYDKKQHFTTPPPRFTEASLVRILEQKAIGRPSTYASIISTIVEREYVEMKEKRIFPTELGRTVLKLLLQNFTHIFDTKFTADMEAGLDKVEAGDEKWLKLLKDFYYGSFSDELAKAETDLQADLRVPNIKCPTCGKELAVKYGKMGQFIACTGYPECSFTSDYSRGEDGNITLVAKKPAEQTGIKCEKCGADMVLKRTRFGEMLACSGYPECKNIKSHIKLPNGKLHVIEVGEKVGDKCPQCGGDVVLKSGKRGVFAACANYPDCKFTASVEADDDGKFILQDKKKVEQMGVCEKCGKQMVVRRSARGPFLACSGYPKCKNTKSMKKAAEEAKSAAS